MRYSIIGLALAAAAGASPASAAAVNLVQNGDFTDLTNGVGQITGHPTTAVGWTTSGYNFVFSSGTTGGLNSNGSSIRLWTADNGGASTWNGSAPVGNFVAMDGDYQTDKVSQSVSGLTEGEQYQVTFDYAFAQQKGYSGDTVQHINVSLGGQTQSTANYALPQHDFSGWFNGAFTFTANASTETLSFLAWGNRPVPPFALVSDVKLMAAPEPATWAMMLLGFAGLGFAGYRGARRGQSAIA